MLLANNELGSQKILAQNNEFDLGLKSWSLKTKDRLISQSYEVGDFTNNLMAKNGLRFAIYGKVKSTQENEIEVTKITIVNCGRKIKPTDMNLALDAGKWETVAQNQTGFKYRDVINDNRIYFDT